MKTIEIRKLIVAALCLALCLVLPFLTGQIPQIGNMLSPMHIPAFLCGFLCGWPYALLVGLIAPPLRFLLFQMPPLFPTGLSMMFELAAYGVSAALLSRVFPKKPAYLYVALILSMLIGRAVWGAVRLVLMGVANIEFGWKLFFAGAFANAVPGILCHILVVPPVVMLVEQAAMKNSHTA